MPRRTGHRNRIGQMAGSRNPSCLYCRISSLLCPVFSGQRFASIPSQATERLLVLRDILACSAASDHDRLTGDVQDNTGDPRCIIRYEIERCVGNVLGCSEALDALLVPLGQDCLRSNAVRSDSVGADLGGKVLGENFEAGLGRRILYRGTATFTPRSERPITASRLPTRPEERDDGLL